MNSYITVIGGANIDISAKSMIVAEQLADSHPGQIFTSPGGVARNIAENLARLGKPVRLISAFGSDLLSQHLKTSLDLPLMDISACYVSDRLGCDVYISFYDNTGELRYAINQMQLVDLLTPSYLSQFETEIKGSEIILADCNLSAPAIDWLTALENRPPLFFDGVSAQKILRLQPHLGKLDGLKCNQKEAAALLNLGEDTAPEKLVAGLCAAGIGAVLLSLGAEGVWLGHFDKQIHFSQDISAQNILSVSGAGDGLLSGFIYGKSLGMDDTQAVQMGLKAAEMSLTCMAAVHPDIGSITAEILRRMN